MDGVGKLKGRWYSSVSDWYTTGPGLRFTPTPPVLSRQGAELTKQLHWPEARSTSDLQKWRGTICGSSTVKPLGVLATVAAHPPQFQMEIGWTEERAASQQGLHSLSSSSVKE